MKSLVDYMRDGLNNITKTNMKLTDSQREFLLKIDKKYNNLIMKFREEHNGKDILNFKEEKEKFLDEYHHDKKYYPVLKFNKDKIEPTKMKQEFEKLLCELNNVPFDCILWKYYRYWLNFFIWVLGHLEKKYEGKYFTVTYPTTVSETDYQQALKILKTTKYIAGVKDGRDKDAEYAKEKIEAAIKELGYNWKVEIHDNMVPRMNVLPNGIVRINQDAKFSDIDIDGLIAHEIKGHIGRRYYGAKMGLYLMLHGLPNRNILDEGLAVWNSLNLTEEPKPNILYNIAMKCVIAYNAQRMDICELFDFMKKICPKVEEEKIIGALLRNKRDEVDTRLLGGDITDASYYIGYKMIDKMTDKQREDVLKYNIGPDQLNDLPLIKEFFKQNKFNAIKVEDM